MLSAKIRQKDNAAKFYGKIIVFCTSRHGGLLNPGEIHSGINFLFREKFYD